MLVAWSSSAFVSKLPIHAFFFCRHLAAAALEDIKSKSDFKYTIYLSFHLEQLTDSSQGTSSYGHLGHLFL